MSGGQLEARYDPWLDDPFPMYARLRALAPVLHQPQLGLWTVARHDDVEAILRDDSRFSNHAPQSADPVAALIGPGDVLDTDRPRHTVLRSVLRERFTAKAVGARAAQARDDARTLLMPLRERGEGDLAEEFAWLLPTVTILRLLGQPPEDADRVSARLRELDDPSDGDAAREAMGWLRSYLLDGIASPAGDGLLLDLVAANRRGTLCSDELGGLSLSVLLAATGTTSSLLSNGLLVLDRHPDQKALVRSGAAEPARAVEELLRFESPVQSLPRHTTREIELHGQAIPPGERILLLLGSANRDERRFADADRFDVLRGRRRHLALGTGVHFCIGTHLARMQAALALKCVFEMLGDYAVAGDVVRIPSPDVRGLMQLPVKVEPGGGPLKA